MHSYMHHIMSVCIYVCDLLTKTQTRQNIARQKGHKGEYDP